MKANHYLNQIQQRYDLYSDYQLSKFLGTSTARISNIRHRNVGFDDDLAIKIANLLDLEPAIVIADMHEQRATDDKVKQVWRNIARRMAGNANILFLLILVAGGVAGEHLFRDASSILHNIYNRYSHRSIRNRGRVDNLYFRYRLADYYN